MVIVDDPIASPALLIDHAAHQAAFSDDGIQAYPGVRANLPSSYAQTLAPELIKIIREVYQIPHVGDPKVVHELFSLVSQPADQLSMLQRVPHFDNQSPFYFATVHYLTAGPHGGTGIFRHRPTGFESISPERYPIFVREAQAHVAAHGPPSERYINASDDHFELIETLEYRPNRLIMYPGYLLHSGLIQPERDISADPVTGRLTANLFMLLR